jgi:hypothetical protein
MIQWNSLLLPNNKNCMHCTGDQTCFAKSCCHCGRVSASLSYSRKHFSAGFPKSLFASHDVWLHLAYMLGIMRGTQSVPTGSNHFRPPYAVKQSSPSLPWDLDILRISTLCFHGISSIQLVQRNMAESCARRKWENTRQFCHLEFNSIAAIQLVVVPVYIHYLYWHIWLPIIRMNEVFWMSFDSSCLLSAHFSDV